MVKPIIMHVGCRAALLALGAGLGTAGCVPFLLDPRDQDRPQDDAAGAPNGCGPAGVLEFLVPECPLGVACFTEACDGHDICYVSCGSDRDACDVRFYDDMRAICVARYDDRDPGLFTCLGLAYIYWQAVARFGEPFFAGSQECDRALSAAGQDRAPPPRVMIGEAPFADEDDDLLPDDWERAVGCDPHDSADTLRDFDGDGINNLQEFLYGTDPFVADGPPEDGPPRSAGR